MPAACGSGRFDFSEVFSKIQTDESPPRVIVPAEMMEVFMRKPFVNAWLLMGIALLILLALLKMGCGCNTEQSTGSAQTNGSAGEKSFVHKNQSVVLGKPASADETVELGDKVVWLPEEFRPHIAAIRLLKKEVEEIDRLSREIHSLPPRPPYPKLDPTMSDETQHKIMNAFFESNRVELTPEYVSKSKTRNEFANEAYRRFETSVGKEIAELYHSWEIMRSGGLYDDLVRRACDAPRVEKELIPLLARIDARGDNVDRATPEEKKAIVAVLGHWSENPRFMRYFGFLAAGSHYDTEKYVTADGAEIRVNTRFGGKPPPGAKPLSAFLAEQKK